MRLATFEQGGTRQVGVVSADGKTLRKLPLDAALAQRGAQALIELRAAGQALPEPVGPTLQVSEVKLVAPLPMAVEELLAKAVQTGRPAEARTRLMLPAGATQIDLSATPFRVADAAGPGSQRLLVRARSAAVDGTSREGEAVVVTDSSGRVVVANAAFRALCRTDADAVEGQFAAELLGDPQRHLAALLVDARRGGLVRRASMMLGGGRVPPFECFAQAALMHDGDQECIGLTLVPASPSRTDSLRSALLALLDQTGEVPLRDLVRRASELAERHAVETALRRSADDHGDTAALLGVSHDDLAERLERLGLKR